MVAASPSAATLADRRFPISPRAPAAARRRRPVRELRADPLHLFRQRSLAAGRRPPRPLQPFNSGEHVWLGNAGALEACQRLRRSGIDIGEEVFARIQRLSRRETFTYGELAALSGDFYETPSELFEEQPGRVPWLWEDNDVSDLGRLFEAEVAWIVDRQRANASRAYPESSVRLAWNARSYLELALRNVDHFGWHNLVAYCRHHATALDLASRARGRAGELWSRALVYNAFADHFLSDAFAAGHVRVPRAEILSWAESRGLSDSLAGVLSKLLHDQDGHVATLHGDPGEGSRSAAGAEAEGLPVRNARGDAWRTYCDAQLFLFPGATTSPAVRLPVEAIAASVVELVTAFKRGALPSGLFHATRLVPFPDPKAPGLAEKFSPGMGARRIKAMCDRAAWYMKLPGVGPGLEPAHVRALLEDLPELMGRLRANVASELARNPLLRTRLAPGYVSGFLNVR